MAVASLEPRRELLPPRCLLRFLEEVRLELLLERVCLELLLAAHTGHGVVPGHGVALDVPVVHSRPPLAPLPAAGKVVAPVIGGGSADDAAETAEDEEMDDDEEDEEEEEEEEEEKGRPRGGDT